MIPGNKILEDTKITSIIDNNKVNFDGKFGSINDTINLSLKTAKKKFEWENIKLSCNSIIDTKKNKRCNHLLGDVKTIKEGEKEKIQLIFPLSNLSYFHKLLKTPHPKKP